jgi:hypothetical protein
MEEQPIVNRVAKSKIRTIDLEKYYPEGRRVGLDISQWLYKGFVVKEKDFRSALKEHDWNKYEDCYVAMYCSTDAIIPEWAYMLVSTYLKEHASKVIYGKLKELELLLFQEAVDKIDANEYKDKPVIIKGCSEKVIPQNAYIQLVQKLQPVVKSMMFGEACSSVPLYKKPRK